ncbi:MAG TPA: GTP-binding protein [Acetobacteraceae bacterium]|jgi:G3E family GTPase|nr:GTP-binding protein [Acetobacteraceae bacterium]
MSDAANTVPVTIITGFLGSGKTTLLNRLLKLPSLNDTVVIVNEFGAVGLDHLLIEQAIEDAVLLKNGCICCTVRGDIADTLETLWERRESGLLPPFRRIAIETTGLADPAPVAHALLTEAEGRYACRLDGIVTTVDALHGAMQLDRQPEARRQVAMADRVLLTKTDLADATAIEAVRARIAALNACAPLRRVVNGDGAEQDVFGLGPGDGADDARVAEWLRPFETDPHHGHQHLPFRHGDEVASVVLRCDQPIGWDGLRLWLESVLSLHGDAVLRLKGLVRLVGVERLVVLQGVHHVLHPSVFLPRQAEDAGGTRIVLITRGLSAKGLRASFAAAIEAAL